MRSTRKKRGTPWGNPIDVCGQRYRIEILDDLNETDGEDGQCDYANGVIRIQDQAPDRMADALIHEIATHAIWDASGLHWMVVQALQLPDEKVQALEEIIAHLYSPALLATLRNASWLQLPKLPVKAKGKRQ